MQIIRAQLVTKSVLQFPRRCNHGSIQQVPPLPNNKYSCTAISAWSVYLRGGTSL